MRHLNHTHLLYFNTVAREGSIARAPEVLHLTPQTISGQLKMLEQSMGAPAKTE
jgi:LysR family transcriptional activator of nhaA